MTTPKFIRTVRYFSVLTFLASAIIVCLTYYSPSSAVINGSVLYGLAFVASTAILLITIVIKAVSQKSKLRTFISAAAWLLLNSIFAFGYFKVWTYAADTIFVEITNNTGYEVTEAGMYGCFAEQWGRLSDGESRTVRFPAGDDCAFAVTYKLNGNTKLELLPRQMGVKNNYSLGTNPSSAPDTKAANTSFAK